MPRPAAAALLVLLALAAAAPPASAGEPALPPPADEDGPVTGYTWQTSSGSCQSYDPLLGAVGLALPSRVSHAPAEGGTRYDLHLESVVPAEGCPALDLSFVTTLAPWPTRDAFASVSSPCGAQGQLAVYVFPEGRHLQLFLNLPAACGAPVEGWLYVGVSMQPLHPSTYVACAPAYVLVAACVGAAEYERTDHRCANGAHYETTYVTLVGGAYRYCDHRTGEDVVVVAPLFEVVRVEARASSCTVVVQDSFLGLVEHRTPCPSEAGDRLYGTDWGDVLP